MGEGMSIYFKHWGFRIGHFAVTWKDLFAKKYCFEVVWKGWKII